VFAISTIVALMTQMQAPLKDSRHKKELVKTFSKTGHFHAGGVFRYCLKLDSTIIKA
jgi:hypothetical protein